jgi:hypothetical protein
LFDDGTPGPHEAQSYFEGRLSGEVKLFDAKHRRQYPSIPLDGERENRENRESETNLSSPPFTVSTILPVLLSRISRFRSKNGSSVSLLYPHRSHVTADRSWPEKVRWTMQGQGREGLSVWCGEEEWIRLRAAEGGVSPRRCGEKGETRTRDEKLVSVLLSVSGGFSTALPERMEKLCRRERRSVGYVLLYGQRIQYAKKREGEEQTDLSKQRVHLARKTRFACSAFRARLSVVTVGEVVSSKKRVDEEGLEDNAEVAAGKGGEVNGNPARKREKMN